MAKNTGRQAVVWFRSDLRLLDNPALHRALTEATQIIPFFTLDPNLLAHDPLVGSARVLFMLESLHDLDHNLREHGSYLVLRLGDPLHTLTVLLDETGADAVYYNVDVDRRYGLERDAALRALFAARGVICEGVQQYAVWARRGTHDEWKQRWRAFNAQPICPTPAHIPTPPDIATSPIPPANGAGLALLDVADLAQEGQPGGESIDLALFAAFLSRKIGRYYFKVSYPAEVDANDATSLLSPHLKFGTLSGRYIIQQCARLLRDVPDLSAGERKSLQRFITRLRWRESMYQSLYEFPNTEFEVYEKAYEGVRRPAEGALFAAWKWGNTGFPMIDAGMRCLVKTGRLAFRIRAACASFVTYGLFMEAQAAKDHFYTYLIDANPINWWQWQLQADTVGWSKYFMIFSPIVQAQKYDPTGAFIRKWVPELTDVPIEHLAQPWLMPRPDQIFYGCVIGRGYPAPIINWKEARAYATATLDPIRLSLAPPTNESTPLDGADENAK